MNSFVCVSWEKAEKYLSSGRGKTSFLEQHKLRKSASSKPFSSLPAETLYQLGSCSPFPLPPAPGKLNLLSVSVDLSILGIPHKWNLIIGGLLYLAFLT